MSEQVSTTVQFVTITDDQDGQRLDNFLKSRLKGVPKSMLYRIIRKGEVRINKKRAKPDSRVQVDDVIRIPPVRMAEKEELPLVGDRILSLINERILYEDDGLIVLNKPSGIAVHGGSGLSFGVIEALRQMRPESSFLELVHRLDRDTSGCLMIAKKRSVLKRLHAYLRDGGLDKTYCALVVGRWKGRKHRVDSPLQKFHLASGERVVKVSRDGKQSLTDFRLLEHLQGATLVEAKPITGRTHQIRVHTQFSGHPIAGDDKYTSRAQNEPFKALGLKRLFLHAMKIQIPGAEGVAKLVVEAPLDEDLQALLTRLR